MIKARVSRIDLQFITPGQTSRGTLNSKPSWFFILEHNGYSGVGECSVIAGLNPEYPDGYEQKIFEIAEKINSGVVPSLDDLDEFPSIRFGLETALLDLQHESAGILFPSAFTRGEKGIPINGLIWMGNKQEMQSRIREKLDQGFRVLKLKVGALDFDEEISLLRNIRNQFKPADLEIRLDANGAFSVNDAPEKLKQLSDFHIHSIEQPIKAGQWEAMAEICHTSPLPVALDEELIGIINTIIKEKMLDTIKPQYIILKPSLIGGLQKSREWIDIAAAKNIGWWATSALESNVGLNAIAQWVFTLNPEMVQGLGTGQVFSNNIDSPLELSGPLLYHRVNVSWDYSRIL
ncbi:MAG: o-succinylbenzoate synthase [Bacteroidetes bacterium]|nr:MAG: o-succinylbenzoate synthase [Bacteroidota bacterium]